LPRFNQDIVALVNANTDFRREILTEKHSQLVLMSIEPGDEIGEETHHVDQVLVFVAGEGEAVLDGEKSPVKADSLVVVPAGVRHNFVNTGSGPLKLYTIYAPPEEEPGALHRTKAEADEAEKDHH
jgi:mannose-6-phosphate isomerase-like protein (cupin superfamily)